MTQNRFTWTLGDLTPNKPTENIMRKCPECGGEMKDGECEDCGHVENVVANNHQSKWSVWRAIGQALGIVSNSNPEGHNQYTGAASARAEAATEAAASHPTGPKHAAAAIAHDKAASLHQEAGNLEEAAHHQEMVQYHQSAGGAALGRQSSKTPYRTGPKTRNASNGQPRHAEKGTYLSPGAGTGKGEVHVQATLGGDHTVAGLAGKQATPDGRQLETVTPTDEDTATAAHDESAERLRRMTGNCMGMTTNDPHQASKQAAAASLHTEHGDAFGHAQKAMAQSAAGSPKRAAGYHVKAAEAHEGAATDARKGDSPQDAMQHDDAAAMHRRAASMHSAMTANEFASDEQRQAFFGLLAGGGGKGPSGAAGKAAGEASTAAHGKSASANKGSRASGHTKAAELHRAAAKAHFTASKDSTDKATADQHATAAKEHNALAKTHEEKASKATRNERDEIMFLTREQALAKLTANCKCEADKIALNTLSDAGLISILNAKASGSNADTVGGGGTVRVGGEETTTDDKNDPELDDDVDIKKKAPAMNAQQLDQLSVALFGRPVAEVRAGVHNAMQIEADAKRQIVERLVANVQDAAVKAQLVTLHSGKSLGQLQLEAQALPPAFNAAAPFSDLRLPPVYAGVNTPTGLPVGNMDSGADDLLDTPTLNYTEMAAERKQSA